MTADEADGKRLELARLAMDLIAKRGSAVTRNELAAESRSSRARIDEIFPEESDLFAAVVELWYSHDIEVMERVVASDLPIQRKFYEFYAQRYMRERERFEEDPALFALYVELGEGHFEQVRGYIDLADHYLTELIAQAQVEGFFSGLDIDRALSLINQMLIAYTSPQVMLMISHRLHEEKLARIIDTIFAGLSAEDNGSSGVNTLRLASS
ncbi:hypothetical protein [Altererythrobacter sp. MF3-039]|uniref:hypothetical protein n=1 Tax=Altererythrobacter sp. MF3-039 TaxID=3252901 RepID=UPI00390C8529